MKTMNLLFILSFLTNLLLVGCDKSEVHNNPNDNDSLEEFSVIPLPQFISYGNNMLELDNNINISCSEDLRSEAEFLKDALNLDLKISSNIQINSDDYDVKLNLDPSMVVKGKGGYKIEISDKNILLTAPENLGIFYGIQTIRQAVIIKNDKFLIRQATVSDYPTHEWRSVMLDEARFFQGKEAVKKLLYEMARLKYNIFHWHLTDDQGWRIEIKKYPNLIEVGSKRPKTGVDYYWNSNEFYNTPHEGHYTQDDIKEIIEYAKQLNITIIPEIELLTHCSAAVASYSYLGTTGAKIDVECRMGTFDEVMNIANPNTMTFIHDVIDEIATLFPGKFIHLGGDEIQGNHWTNSSEIQQMKQNLGITEDYELQIYFFNEISKYLANKNKKLMAWGDCIGRPGKTSKIPVNLASGTIIQYWKGTINDLNYLLNHGLQVVQSHTDGFYFNAWLPDAYNKKCIPDEVDTSQRSQILGLGAECWTEFDTTVEETFDHIFPRIAAYAETGWSKPESKDYKSFVRRLGTYYDLWLDNDIYVGGTEE